MPTPRLASLVGLCALLAAPLGCRCGDDDSDAGSDGGVDLLSTDTIVAVSSTLTGVERLHLTLTASEPAFGGPCAYIGMMWEGFVPEIAVGTLDMSCPNFPFGCPTFHIHWAGVDTTDTPLGGMTVTGVGEITCQIMIEIEALDAGGNVVGTGSTTDAFAYYGVAYGPFMAVTIQ